MLALRHSAPDAMESVEIRVQNFKVWLKEVMEVQERDSSHGMAHFERVRRRAIEIAGKTGPLSTEESLILQLAALCHDVLDHKYMAKIAKMQEGGSGDMTSKEDLKTTMKEALKSLSRLSPRQVEDVCLISDNISLSKELAGLLEEDILMERRLTHLRDYVSDADKLDALGVGGLKRLAQYQARILQDSGSSLHHLSSSFLREMAQKHLLHRINYLRTQDAIVEGGRLLRETTCIMASDAALERIIDWALIHEMKAKATASRRGGVAGQTEE